MKRRLGSFILIVSAALLLLSGLALAEETFTTAHVTLTYQQTEAREMLAAINTFRQGPNAWYWNEDDATKTVLTDLGPLTYDYDLEKTAMQRAAEIAVMFEHTRPNGQSCFTAFPALNAQGENIAAGQVTAQAAFVSWQETDEPYAHQGHRRNMLKATFNAIGIGHVVRGGIHYWTQALGYKASPGGETTDPVDGEAVVEVLISDGFITDRTSALTPEAITLDIGQSAALPSLSVSFAVAGAWPERPYSEAYTPQWVAEDGTKLSLTANALTALHAGETRLTAEDYAVPVTVNPLSLEGAEIAVAAGDYVYRGKANAITPAITVRCGGADLARDVDYTVAYQANAQAGDALVVVTGTGDYSGELTAGFTIAPCVHEWGEPMVVKSPSYDEQGQQVATCVRCGDEQVSALPVVPKPTAAPTAEPSPEPGPTPVTDWQRDADTQTIRLPEDVKVVEQGAFEGVTADEVVLPEGIERIEERAFADSDIKHVNLPESIEHIDDTAFEDVENLQVDTADRGYAADWAVRRGYAYTPDGAFEYVLEDGACAVTRYTGRMDSVNIPAAIEGTPVTRIGAGAFEGCDTVKEIVVPADVSDIGANAFAGCAALTRVNIPGGVTALADGLFMNCTSLESFPMPDEVTSIGDRAFKGCAALKRFTVSDSLTHIGSEAFSGCGRLQYLFFSNKLESIGENALAGCDSLTVRAWRGTPGEAFVKASGVNYTVYDPQFILYGDELLTYWGYDTAMVIPADLGATGIFDRAFEGKGMYDMLPLSSVTMPEGMTRIGARAFYGCDVLRTVNIPESMQIIDSEAFYMCRMLDNVRIPGNVAHIGESAFSYCEEMTSVTFTDGLVGIADGAFNGCKKLKTVALPDTVKSIGSAAFLHCDAMTAITFPDGLSSIGSGAFMNCGMLNNVALPASLKTVPHNAFWYCTRLSNVTLPEGLEAISSYAFSNCKNLKTLTIPASVTFIHEYAFDHTYLQTVRGAAGSYAEAWAREKGINFEVVE